VEMRLARIQVKSEMVEKEIGVLMKEVREKEELCVSWFMFILFERFD